MTYLQHPTCRRGGCGEPVSEVPARDEGDIGWCDVHRLEVRLTRARLTVGVKPGRFGYHRPVPAQRGTGL